MTQDATELATLINLLKEKLDLFLISLLDNADPEILQNLSEWNQAIEEISKNPPQFLNGEQTKFLNSYKRFMESLGSDEELLYLVESISVINESINNILALNEKLMPAPPKQIPTSEIDIIPTPALKSNLNSKKPRELTAEELLMNFRSFVIGFSEAVRQILVQMKKIKKNSNTDNLAESVKIITGYGKNLRRVMDKNDLKKLVSIIPDLKKTILTEDLRFLLGNLTGLDSTARLDYQLLKPLHLAIFLSMKLLENISGFLTAKDKLKESKNTQEMSAIQQEEFEYEENCLLLEQIIEILEAQGYGRLNKQKSDRVDTLAGELNDKEVDYELEKFLFVSFTHTKRYYRLAQLWAKEEKDKQHETSPGRQQYENINDVDPEFFIAKP